MYSDERGNVKNKLITGQDSLNTRLRKLRIYAKYCIRVMAYNRRGDGVASDLACAYTDQDGK